MDEDVQRLLRDRSYEQAFELLVERYQQKVFRLSFSMLRDPDRALDAAQEVFLKVWRALPRYDESASLSTWLFTITRNTCLTSIRSSSYRAASSLEEPAVRAVAQSLTHSPAPVLAGIDVKALLGRLPATSREVVSLFYFQEKSYEDVAAMLNMPIGTVKSHLHRAKRALGEMVTGRVRSGSGKVGGED